MAKMTILTAVLNAGPEYGIGREPKKDFITKHGKRIMEWDTEKITITATRTDTKDNMLISQVIDILTGD